jgi:hypothetical protein
VTPGFGGTITAGIDSSLAIATPCSAPAPPKATSAKSRDQADRIRHVGVGDADDGVGGRLARQAERLGDTVDGIGGERGVEHDLAAGEVRPQPPQHHVGVGVGGLMVAVAVTGGTGIGARRLRAVAQ